MFVSAQEFLDKTRPIGFDSKEFQSTMWNLTDHPHSLDVAKRDNVSPYIVLFADTDCISMTFIAQKHLDKAADDENTVVDAFELLKHLAH